MPLRFVRRLLVKFCVAWLGVSLCVGIMERRVSASDETPAWHYLNIVGYLSAPEREGRGVGSAGLVQAENFVADRFTELGISPVWFGVETGFDGRRMPVEIKIKDAKGDTTQIFVTNNVMGQLGAGCGNTQPVLAGAHLDHLGYGERYALDPELGRVVRPGADDNASGIAALLTAAEQLKQKLFEAPELSKQLCLLFVAFTGEEEGIRGSSALVKLLKAHKIAPKAMLNFDMVGRMKENKLIVMGTQTAVEWPGIVRGFCDDKHLKCNLQTSSSGGSDHVAFVLANVPSIFFFTGLHGDYHKATDTVDKINADGGVSVASLAAQIVLDVAKTERNLTFVANPEPEPGQTPTPGERPYLGTIPDFGGEDTAVKGVLLSGAQPGSPAALAGIKEGDIVLAVDQYRTETLEAYSLALRTLRQGQRVILKIWRNDEELDVSVVVGRK